MNSKPYVQGTSGQMLLFFMLIPVWTISHIVPAHAQDMKSKYGLGLDLNSMQGRDAKHVFISKYSNNNIHEKITRF